MVSTKSENWDSIYDNLLSIVFDNPLKKDNIFQDCNDLGGKSRKDTVNYESIDSLYSLDIEKNVKNEKADQIVPYVIELPLHNPSILNEQPNAVLNAAKYSEVRETCPEIPQAFSEYEPICPNVSYYKDYLLPNQTMKEAKEIFKDLMDHPVFDSKDQEFQPYTCSPILETQSFEPNIWKLSEENQITDFDDIPMLEGFDNDLDFDLFTKENAHILEECTLKKELEAAIGEIEMEETNLIEGIFDNQLEDNIGKYNIMSNFSDDSNFKRLEVAIEEIKLKATNLKEIKFDDQAHDISTSFLEELKVHDEVQKKRNFLSCAKNEDHAINNIKWFNVPKSLPENLWRPNLNHGDFKSQLGVLQVKTKEIEHITKYESSIALLNSITNSSYSREVSLINYNTTSNNSFNSFESGNDRMSLQFMHRNRVVSLNFDLDKLPEIAQRFVHQMLENLVNSMDANQSNGVETVLFEACFTSHKKLSPQCLSHEEIKENNHLAIQKEIAHKYFTASHYDIPFTENISKALEKSYTETDVKVRSIVNTNVDASSDTVSESKISKKRPSSLPEYRESSKRIKIENRNMSESSEEFNPNNDFTLSPLPTSSIGRDNKELDLKEIMKILNKVTSDTSEQNPSDLKESFEIARQMKKSNKHLVEWENKWIPVLDQVCLKTEESKLVNSGAESTNDTKSKVKRCKEKMDPEEILNIQNEISDFSISKGQKKFDKGNVCGIKNSTNRLENNSAIDVNLLKEFSSFSLNSCNNANNEHIAKNEEKVLDQVCPITNSEDVGIEACDIEDSFYQHLTNSSNLLRGIKRKCSSRENVNLEDLTMDQNPSISNKLRHTVDSDVEIKNSLTILDDICSQYDNMAIETEVVKNVRFLWKCNPLKIPVNKSHIKTEMQHNRSSAPKQLKLDEFQNNDEFTHVPKSVKRKNITTQHEENSNSEHRDPICTPPFLAKRMKIVGEPEQEIFEPTDMSELDYDYSEEFIQPFERPKPSAHKQQENIVEFTSETYESKRTNRHSLKLGLSKLEKVTPLHQRFTTKKFS